MLKLLIKILGKTPSWRLGRALYIAARGEDSDGTYVCQSWNAENDRFSNGATS